MNNETYKTAAEIAASEIYFIDGLATIAEAIAEMERANTEFLMIRRRDKKDAHAILTVTDIIHKVIAKDSRPSEVSVYEVMSKPAIAIPAHLNVRYIPRMMQKAGIRYAPVEDGDKLVGTIGPRELLRSATL
jgi:CBS domain-containing protein